MNAHLVGTCVLPAQADQLPQLHDCWRGEHRYVPLADERIDPTLPVEEINGAPFATLQLDDDDM
jgi:hypothetical protein